MSVAERCGYVQEDHFRGAGGLALGYGHAGSVFPAPLVGSTPCMRVAAIVTASPDRVARARCDFRDARVLPSADVLWQNSRQYDLVVVAAPNRVHVPLGLAALEAGLPVVIDKPVAASVADARALMTIAERTGTGPCSPFFVTRAGRFLS